MKQALGQHEGYEATITPITVRCKQRNFKILNHSNPIMYQSLLDDQFQSSVTIHLQIISDFLKSRIVLSYTLHLVSPIVNIYIDFITLSLASLSSLSLSLAYPGLSLSRQINKDMCVIQTYSLNLSPLLESMVFYEQPGLL